MNAPQAVQEGAFRIIAIESAAAKMADEEREAQRADRAAEIRERNAERAGRAAEMRERKAEMAALVAEIRERKAERAYQERLARLAAAQERKKQTEREVERVRQERAARRAAVKDGEQREREAENARQERAAEREATVAVAKKEAEALAAQESDLAENIGKTTRCLFNCHIGYHAFVAFLRELLQLIPNMKFGSSTDLVDCTERAAFEAVNDDVADACGSECLVLECDKYAVSVGSSAEKNSCAGNEFNLSDFDITTHSSQRCVKTVMVDVNMEKRVAFVVEHVFSGKNRKFNELIAEFRKRKADASSPGKKGRGTGGRSVQVKGSSGRNRQRG
jgi:hypothetical protein